MEAALDRPDDGSHTVAIIGAGPAGLFAAKELAAQGFRSVLFNRDIKPGGLAEYGIYPDKHKMKDGLRNQFRQILALENVGYYGNLTVGCTGDLTLDDLRGLGFQAILVTAGAQGTKWLGLPGENALGVYHAKDLVYHYNSLPPYSQQQFHIGRRVAVVGVGNVMMDVSRYLIQRVRVERVYALARRGPGEIKFDKKELGELGHTLDLQAFNIEMDCAADVMRSVGQDPETVRSFVCAAIEKAPPAQSPGKLQINFLVSPVAILSDSRGIVSGIDLEENTLVEANGEIKARGTGRRKTLDVDTVIFAIGDRVDETLCLPMSGAEFVKSPHPRFPSEGISFELYDPETDKEIEDVFVAGWSRLASTGLVGIARRDGTLAARAICQYLQTLPASEPAQEKVAQFLNQLGKKYVDKAALNILQAVERMRAEALGNVEFKFQSNEEMLAAIYS
jgi:ferredoxin--NADP+ reductase